MPMESLMPPTLAFDLELSAPAKLETRPAEGWCFGRPPGIDADRWPVSPLYETPLRHAFTLKLPEPYRTRGPDLVAISLFVDEMFRESDLAPLPHSASSRRQSGEIDPHRFDMEHWGFHLTLFWLSEDEFASPLGTSPEIDADGGASMPGWRRMSPADYFGRDSLPRDAFHRARESGSGPGAYALQQLMASEQPPSGWATLPAAQALDHGFPIRVSVREGDPNVGRRPSEDEDENRRSGYIPIYSDQEGAADLERFAQFDAHLGGTMLPMQAYPPVSPFYLEFGDTFGGFAFGGGTTQLDLGTMRITWAS